MSAGKGSARRPAAVDDATVTVGWSRTFGGRLEASPGTGGRPAAGQGADGAPDGRDATPPRFASAP